MGKKVRSSRHSRPDSFVPTIVLLVAVATAFSVQGGAGRPAELMLIGAAAVTAYLAPWRVGRLVPPAAALIYLVLELHYHRLDQGRYWEQVLDATAILSAVFASAYAGYALEHRKAGFEQAVAQSEESATEDRLADLLSGARRLTSLDYELERSRRHNHVLSLLIVRADDLDDTALRWGEAATRDVLREVAELIGTHVRVTDVPFRYGAYDFCVILPETPAPGARVVAERIRLAVSGRRLEFGPGELVNLTVSIGVAAFPDDATSNAELSRAAARALARAVEVGGNRTVLHTVSPDVPPGWGLGEPPVATPAG